MCFPFCCLSCEFPYRDPVSVGCWLLTESFLCVRHSPGGRNYSPYFPAEFHHADHSTGVPAVNADGHWNTEDVQRRRTLEGGNDGFHNVQNPMVAPDRLSSAPGLSECGVQLDPVFKRDVRHAFTRAQ